MIEALANYVVTKKKSSSGKIYGSPRIYLPTKLTTDSAFPLKGNLVRVLVRIDGKRLIIKEATPRIRLKFGESPSFQLRRRRLRRMESVGKKRRRHGLLRRGPRH